MKKPFQFRLRTLMIVVTLLAMPCWYAAGQRRIVIARAGFERDHPEINICWQNDAIEQWGRPRFEVPWMRRLLGDRTATGIVILNDASADDVEAAKRLFDEAEVIDLRGKRLWP
jgi:phenolic acid decarboxylase